MGSTAVHRHVLAYWDENGWSQCRLLDRETYALCVGKAEEPSVAAPASSQGPAPASEGTAPREPAAPPAIHLRVLLISDLPAPTNSLRKPRGCFSSLAPASGELERDFARVVLAPQRRLFVSFQGSAWLHPMEFGPAIVHASRGGRQAAQWARLAFEEGIARQLERHGGTAIQASTIKRLCDCTLAAMSAGVGVDFAEEAELLPCVYQPLYLLSFISDLKGPTLQVQFLSYGYVAQHLEQICGALPDVKYSPWCACLSSPDLLQCDPAAGTRWQWGYRVQEVRARTIQTAVEDEVPRIWGLMAGRGATRL